MTGVPAHRVKRGDTITVPATFTGRVTRRSRPSPSGAVLFEIATREGTVRLTVPSDTEVQITGMTIQEDQ